MCTLFAKVIFCCTLLLINGEGPYTPSDNAAFYPLNSLNNPGALFPLGGDIPSSRVHHTISASSDYLFVYGGYAADGSILGDINLFYIPSEQWSGPIVRKQCCNRRGENIESIGADGNINFGQDGDFPDVSAGFEGDAPLPRAEHTSCVIGEEMYTFGGVTDQYNYVNDLYKFDPIAVQWSIQDASSGSSFPRRRAGHSMVCDTSNRMIYVFGGRTTFNRAADATTMGQNDLWRYDTYKATWTLLTRTANQASAPGQRQYASMLQLNNDLYLYGGVDPANGLVYNDVWVFRLGIQQWQRLYAHRTGHAQTSTEQYPTGDTAYQFAPPPLFLAHLLPIPESLDPTTGINTTFYGSAANSTRVQNGGFLLYGGVGGGGRCGARVCEALETSLGQVYRFSLLEGAWTSPHTITGSVDKSSDINDPLHELQYVQSSAWQYARISSAPHVTDVTLNPFGEPSTTLPFQGSVGADSWHDRGKWVKTFGYERVVFHPQRNLMYEFGGMIARPRTHHSDNGSGSSAGVLTPQGQSSTLSSADVVAQEAAGAGSGATRTATGATPIVLDTASGNVHRPLWDRNSGENLEQVVALPVNGFWDYTDGFSVSALEDGAFKPVEFLRAFRTYTVSPSDIVLVKQENFV